VKVEVFVFGLVNTVTNYYVDDTCTSYNKVSSELNSIITESNLDFDLSDTNNFHVDTIDDFLKDLSDNQVTQQVKEKIITHLSFSQTQHPYGMNEVMSSVNLDDSNIGPDMWEQLIRDLSMYQNTILDPSVLMYIERLGHGKIVCLKSKYSYEQIKQEMEKVQLLLQEHKVQQYWS
jgi:hypothetical protein